MTLTYQTMAEIERSYPNEWVLIDQPKTDKTQHVLGGYVLFHSPDRLAVHEKVKELPTPVNIAVWFIGDFPADEEVLLNL